MRTTDETLLDRVKEMDAHEAWKIFYQLYWRPIIQYGRKIGLDEIQAEDVLQDTMVTLMHVLPEFKYDRERGRFRNFLLTIVHRKALGAIRRNARINGRFDSDSLGEAVDSSAVDELDERRWRQCVLAAVIQEMRESADLSPRDLAVFEAVAVQGRSGRDVAAEFGLTADNVYQIKTRLLRRLRAAVNRRLRS